uniref:hypothetical protein n=1 Tax=Pararhizobium sp. IMCC3301 TaxID=3067904 RepID=UPI0027407C2C|nr:hypothetical protein [Pararhizobium sp. IMCC3301]
MSERLARSNLLLVWPLCESGRRCRLCSFAGTRVTEHLGCGCRSLCARDFFVAFPGHFAGLLPLVVPESGSASIYTTFKEGTEDEHVGAMIVVLTSQQIHPPKRPHSAIGGKPPAVLYPQINETSQPDQQAQTAI